MIFSIGIYSCPMHLIHLVGLYTTKLPVFRWKARVYDWILVDSIGQPSAHNGLRTATQECGQILRKPHYSWTNYPLHNSLLSALGNFPYSGTPPYDHLVITTLLFRPNIKITESFYYLGDPIYAITSLLQQGFYDPTVVAFTWFHCTLTLV